MTAYLAAHASVGVKPSTLTRRLAAIGYAHRLASLPSRAAHKAMRVVMCGIRRKCGTAPAQKAPVTEEWVTSTLARDREHLFAFVRDRDLLTTNNASKRALRSSVTRRNVTKEFRSHWSADTSAAFRIVSTAKANSRSVRLDLRQALGAISPDMAATQLG